MKRRIFLKMFSAVGVLPFVGGEPSQVETPETPQVNETPYTMGSAYVGSAVPAVSGTAMFMGTGVIYDHSTSYWGEGWRIDAPTFDGDE